MRLMTEILMEALKQRGYAVEPDVFMVRGDAFWVCHYFNYYISVRDSHIWVDSGHPNDHPNGKHFDYNLENPNFDPEELIEEIECILLQNSP